MKTILLALLVTGSLAIAAKVVDRDSPNPPEEEFDSYHRFVFYAVLEGCYEDGVTAEDLDLIVPEADNGEREMTANLVYACPLCHPTFEALRIYASRKPFYGQKGTIYDTFGQGLGDELKAQLQGGATERREAIQSLISRWVARRADLLRLDKIERKALDDALREKKDEGERVLKGFQEGANGGYYKDKNQDWKKCPVCAGADEAPMGIK